MSTSGAAAKGGPPSGPAGGDLGGAYPNPGVTKIQGTPVSAVAPTNGQLFELVGGVWTPSSLVIPAAGATVTGPDAFGAAAAVGASTAYSRADHDHGLPAAPAVPGPAATVTGPDAFGAAAAVGASALFARGDHDHGLPANPSAAFAAPAITLGTAAAAGVAATKIRSDATLVAFDVTAPVVQALGDAAAVGAAAVAARRDHRHGMPALAATVTGPDAYGAAAAVGVSALPARADHDHGLPAAPAASLTSATSFAAGNTGLSANTPAQVTSLSLAAGTWLVMGQAAVLTTGGAGSVEIVLAVTTASMSPALGGMSFPISATTSQHAGGHFACIVTPGSTTTYFLNIESTLGNTVVAGGQFSTSSVFSGLVAVKIG